MVTYSDISSLARLREEEFCKMEKRLLKLAISKFFPHVEDRVIDFELVEYVRNSKLKVEEYDRIAIIALSLSSLLGDDDHYFSNLVKKNRFENMRDLTYEVLG